MVRRGYTLIELLVVVSIIALVFSVSTASYRGYQRRQYLEANARNVLADLRLAQEYALGGKVDNPEECASFNGYKFFGGDNKYYIYRRCGGSDVEYKNVTLPEGVTITVRGSDTSITNFVFKPLGRGLDFPPSSTTPAACVTIMQGSSSKFIRIDRNTANIEVVNSASECL